MKLQSKYEHFYSIICIENVVCTIAAILFKPQSMKAVDDAVMFGIVYTNIDHYTGHTEWFIDRQSNNSDLHVPYATMPQVTTRPNSLQLHSE